MQDPIRLLTERLRQSGLRATPQRVITYRALCRLNRHVTAVELLAEVADQMPNVALPTIYATLDVLEKLGLVRRIATVGDSAVYDPVTDSHQHTLCSTCGQMEDLAIDFDLQSAKTVAASVGFQARDLDVVIHGLCRVCAAGPHAGLAGGLRRRSR